MLVEEALLREYRSAFHTGEGLLSVDVPLVPVQGGLLSKGFRACITGVPLFAVARRDVTLKIAAACNQLPASRASRSF